MKRKYLIPFFILSFILSACEKTDNDTCIINWPADTYYFPVRPGMDEWGDLTTSRQIDSVLTIPDSILADISTKGLVQTCMNYPRMIDLFSSYDFNFQESFNILFSGFNGLQELYNRKDCAQALTDYYSVMSPECKKNNWSEVFENPSFLFAWIEIIISQWEIIDAINEDQKTSLCSAALTNYQKKESLSFSIFSQKTSLLISGRIMLTSNFEPFLKSYNSNVSIKDFIDTSVLNGNYSSLDTVEYYTIKFLSKNI